MTIDDQLQKEQIEKEMTEDELNTILECMVDDSWSKNKHKYPEALSYRSWRLGYLEALKDHLPLE